MSILRPLQTDPHGLQGVECDGDPVRWMGESFARSSSSIAEVSQPVRPNPDTIQAEAVAKVGAIKKALKKAQEVAREQPIAEWSKSARISSSASPDESTS